MIDVSSDSHLQTSSQCLEDAFDLVVLVLTLSLDVEIHFCGIGETFEEMQEHLRGHLTNLLTFELRIPYQPRSASEIEGY